MPTLAELRTKQPSRPEVAMPVCLDGALVDRMRKAVLELDELRQIEGMRPKRVDHRIVELRDLIAALQTEIDAEAGVLLVRASPPNGEWRRFVDANPPRSQGEAGHERDVRLASGLVNADALLESLAPYAHSWNGEVLAAGDWDALSASIGGGDLAMMVTTVVSLYEGAPDFTMRRAVLSEALSVLTDYASPAVSGSVTSDSMAGSPSEPSGGMAATVSE